jgi:predicted DNA binding CopG/RHH family protein
MSVIKEGFIQVRVSKDLERKVDRAAKKSHSGNISAFVRDALHDRVGGVEVVSGSIRLPYSVLSAIEEKAKEAGVPLDEFVHYLLTKSIVEG